MSYIHPSAIIYPNVTIGENCYIGPYCIIGAPPEWKGHEEESKGVIIGDNVRITGHVTIDSGAIEPTIIGDNCYIMKGVHIGHDAIIQDNVTLSCHSIIGGHTKLGVYCNMGLGSIAHQKIEIPDYVMVGMGGIVTKKSKLESWGIYAGNPVRFISENEHLKKIINGRDL